MGCSGYKRDQATYTQLNVQAISCYFRADLGGMFALKRQQTHRPCKWDWPVWPCSSGQGRHGSQDSRGSFLPYRTGQSVLLMMNGFCIIGLREFHFSSRWHVSMQHQLVTLPCRCSTSLTFLTCLTCFDMFDMFLCSTSLSPCRRDAAPAWHVLTCFYAAPACHPALGTQGRWGYLNTPQTPSKLPPSMVRRTPARLLPCGFREEGPTLLSDSYALHRYPAGGTPSRSSSGVPSRCPQLLVRGRLAPVGLRSCNVIGGLSPGSTTEWAGLLHREKPTTQLALSLAVCCWRLKILYLWVWWILCVLSRWWSVWRW